MKFETIYKKHKIYIMITKRIKNGIEFDFDTETKMFLNPETNKWVNNPRLQKGKFKGVNVGKNLKSKEKLSKSKLESRQPRFYIPTLITKEIRMNIAKKHKLDFEKLSLILSNIVFHTIKEKNDLKDDEDKLKEFKKTHFVEISVNEWKYYLNDEYIKYLRVLLSENLIETDNYFHFNNTAPESNKCKNWRIHTDYISKDSTNSYYYELMNNPKLRLKIIKKKMDNLLYWVNKSYPTRAPFIVPIFNSIQSIDTIKWKDYYNENIFEFYDIRNPTDKGRKTQLKKILDKGTKQTPNELFDLVEKIQEGNMYFNLKDKFGERLHTLFTNTQKSLRRTIKFENDRYGLEIDLKNSQMIFLALLIMCPEGSIELMPDKSEMILELNKYRYHPDIIKFAEEAKKGNLYEYVTLELGKKLTKTSRNATKTNMFRIFFSGPKHFKKMKLKYSKIFPTLIQVCNDFNTGSTKWIPKLCQMFESRLLIENVGFNYLTETKSNLVTVHDSFIINEDNFENFNNVFNLALENKKIDKEYFKTNLKIKNFNDI